MFVSCTYGENKIPTFLKNHEIAMIMSHTCMLETSCICCIYDVLCVVLNDIYVYDGNFKH